MLSTPRPRRHCRAAPTSGADDLVIVPNIWIRIRLDEWNARAEALGGTVSALAAAFTARLDRHMGRKHGDADDVRMLLTVNTRTMDDARAVAVSFVRVGIDPDGRDDRSDCCPRRDQTGAQGLPKTLDDESAELVALTPFTPKRAWKHLIDYAVSDPEQPAVCSSLGDTGPAASRPDGTLCDGMFARGASQNVTRGWLEANGQPIARLCRHLDGDEPGRRVRARLPARCCDNQVRSCGSWPSAR